MHASRIVVINKCHVEGEGVEHLLYPEPLVRRLLYSFVSCTCFCGRMDESQL